VTSTAIRRIDRSDSSGRTGASGLAPAALAAVSVVATVVMVWTCLAHWAWRVPSPFERGPVDAAILVLTWTSVAAGFGVGLWLWARAPRNRTGRWLWLAALSNACFYIGAFTPSVVANPLVIGGLLPEPLLAMAFLGWPAGRPSERVTRWIVVVAVGRVVTGVASGLFLSSTYPWDWPQVMSPWQVAWVGLPLAAVSAWVFGVLPAIAAAVMLVRRHRRLPAPARRLSSAVTVSGVAVAVLSITWLVAFNLGSGHLYDEIFRPSAVFRWALVAERSTIGVAAVGLAWAFTRRRRTVTGSGGTLEVDLDGSGPVVAPTDSLRRLLGDPTARALFVRPDGGWSDDSGRPSAPDEPGRTSTLVLDGDGEPIGAVDLDATAPVSPALVEIAIATSASRLQVERSTALARATGRELVAVQHAVLDASDAARRRLERDLHDGAQQRLVGLALSARLAARRPDRDEVAGLVSGIEDAADELVELVENGPPAVLRDGLAAGLSTLAMACPIPVVRRIDGDLPGDDPAAAPLWFVANDAIANAVKHAAATRVDLGLDVRHGVAMVSVADDGVGGVPDPPASIAARARDAGAELSFTSPPGSGTRVTVTIRREPGR
jgi:signal transduction histidine kinase